MKRIRRWAVAAALCAATWGGEKAAQACGYSDTVMFVAEVHPDLPLNGYASGRLGLVRTSFARSYLTVAYRWLAGKPLDAREQAGAMGLWRGRIGADLAQVDAAYTAPSAGTPVISPSEPWDRMRALVSGTPPGGPVPTTLTQNYAVVDNCLGDAFVTAARALDERVRRYGKSSPRVKRWVEAQDTVFDNCDGGSHIVPELANPQDASEQADRAYQIAASHFYSGALVEAEQRFRQIGTDQSSPWRHTARLMVVRAKVRRASLSGPTPDKAVLAEADLALQAILTEPAMAPVHLAARRYEGVVLGRFDPARLSGLLGVSLARGGLGDRFGQSLSDYTWALDADAAPLAPTAPDADRLTAWIGAMQGQNPAAFDRAERLYRESHSVAWLVAALSKAELSHGARLDPLLRDAAAVGPESPAYATVQYHRLRLSTEREPTVTRYREVSEVRAKLGAGASRSTLNALLPWGLRGAPDLNALLDESHTVPAGVSSGDMPVAFPYRATGTQAASDFEMFYEEAANTLGSRLPMTKLEQAVKVNRLPKQLQAQLSWSVFVRASLLGDSETVRRAGPVAIVHNPLLAEHVRRVLAAPNPLQRRLAVLMTLLQVPNSSPEVETWSAEMPSVGAVDTAYGGYWWCGPGAAGAAPRGAEVRFLSEAEKTAAGRERARLDALGAGATFLATEAAALAEQLPGDPRVPEALHLAVRATRFGCKDAATTSASRRAFRVLHQRYAKSSWAERTPYYY